MKKIFLTTFFLLGCQGNLFKDMASVDEDQYLLLQAKQAINAARYTEAIDILEVKVSLGSQVKAEFVETAAVAYAGHCGLNFAAFVNDLSIATTGTAFYLVMTPFVGDVVSPASCLTALNKMESLGTTSTRTSNQNAFVAIVGMSLMGTQVRQSADKSPAEGDGTVDQPLCAIPDSEVDNIVLGFGFMSQNFGSLSTSQLGSSSHTAIDETISQCAAVAGASCQITDPANITTQIRDTMRDLINTQEYGLGVVVTGGNPVLIDGACP